MSTVKVSCNVPVSAQEFYETWLCADDLREWLGDALRGMEFGLSGEVVRVELDPRVGGSFYYSDMREGEESPHWGTYLELEPGKRISFTWFPEEEQETKSVVTLDLEDVEEGSSVVKCTHLLLPEWAEFHAQTEIGWKSTIRACGAYAAGKKG